MYTGAASAACRTVTITGTQWRPDSRYTDFRWDPKAPNPRCGGPGPAGRASPGSESPHRASERAAVPSHGAGQHLSEAAAASFRATGAAGMSRIPRHWHDTMPQPECHGGPSAAAGGLALRANFERTATPSASSCIKNSDTGVRVRSPRRLRLTKLRVQRAHAIRTRSRWVPFESLCAIGPVGL